MQLRDRMYSLPDDEQTLSRRGRRRSDSGPLPAVLRVVYPASCAAPVPLRGRRAVLGRAPGDPTTPAVSHETVSRAHAAIEWDGVDRVHVLRDLGSHNGTRVDGVALGPHQAAHLDDGAVVQLGDVLAVYERAGIDTPPAHDVFTEHIPGDSWPARKLRAAVGRAAPDPSPVLLIGETGTGKEWVARELHRLSRRRGALVTVNCAALSPQLIESQLFGHVRGAFTGATADSDGLFRAAAGGTLFLDEIGELPASLQPKLLRALQEREVQPVGSTAALPVDVRVIAATNRDLRASVERGEFRRDLYARLALWEIRVPALRERRSDVLAWIERLHRAWLERRGERAAALALHADAAEAVLLHAWPDNLRGVDRLVHELASTATGRAPVARHALPPWLRQPDEPAEPAAARPGPRARPPAPTADEFAAALAEEGGNVRALARRFGRDRRQIYRWIEAHGLTAELNRLRDS